LAPVDPPDRRSARRHRGAVPQERELPDWLIPLGRTIGFPANGAVSNLMCPDAGAVAAMRNELRHGGYDVVHVHEPVCPVVGWDTLMSCPVPLVGTFHCYSTSALSNGIAVGLGARRRLNRLKVRIAVSEAAAWTARRFFGGRYAIVPNGVDLDPFARPHAAAEPGAPLRIAFVGQAVERKGLPILLRAFEALREHVPATLTLVGASAEEVAHMMLDGRGVRALGKVSEQRKLAELARADLLCAPSLGGESFGMILTEAFATATPVLASDIPGYRDVVRDGIDGRLVPAGDPLALAESLRRLALDAARRRQMARAARERAERFAWPHVAAEVHDCYERAIALADPARLSGRSSASRFALRHGFAPADLQPRVPAQRLPSLAPVPPPLVGRERRARVVRRAGVALTSLAGGALGALALQRVGVTRILASLLASKPGLILAALALMCAAMFTRAISWHAILAASPTWRRARRRDAMQGTFIGVLMSATLPARLGESSRALIVARRIGRARESLPLVLGTIVSQAMLNLLALAILCGVTLSSVRVLDGHDRGLLLVALAPLVALVVTRLLPLLAPSSAVPRARSAQLLLNGARRGLARLRDGLRLFAVPRQAAKATLAQLSAWALQWLSCWLLLIAFGLNVDAAPEAAAGVLFAVNVTAILPATPANVGVFQAACVAVLAGAYHVSTADAIAYGIVLQVIELATAVLMGVPALLNEGLSWREVRLRTTHGAPVRLGPLPQGQAAPGVSGR
jgi:phosphatidylinositol alpha-mannosyltransferase